MDMKKEIERIEAPAENKRDCVYLANFWKMYALEIQDKYKAELESLRAQIASQAQPTPSQESLPKELNIDDTPRHLPQKEARAYMNGWNACLESINESTQPTPSQSEPIYQFYNTVNGQWLDISKDAYNINSLSKKRIVYLAPPQDGYVLVPIEPTEEMIKELSHEWDSKGATSMYENYAAMLKAAMKEANNGHQ